MNRVAAPHITFRSLTPLSGDLLEQGLAERKDAWEFGDWEKL